MVEQLKEISSTDLLERMKSDDLIVVDIRSVREHQDECLEGSKNIPIENFDDYNLSALCENTAVFYCRGGHRTSQAAELLKRQPFKEILILEGGIMAWKAKQLKTIKSTKAPIDLMRQVQIIAGSLVVVGVILGLFVNPNYILISGFVGVGLFFAGVSGFCGMARVLSFMPWNKRIN
ncbi:MAG: rhodanese-like domain-containing protein [Halopseudomonas aestusnigri]